MKHSSLITALGAILTLVSCTGGTATKDLVVYFSKTGGTKAFAEAVALKSGADLLELQLVSPYPESYDATIEESRDECANSTGRALVNGKIDLSQYKRVFVAYPVWYGTIAPPIVTLARENGLFADKDVVLLCTFGSGGTRTSSNAFKDLCPDANVLGAFGISAQRVALHAGEEAESLLAALENPQRSKDLLGGYSERRELNEQDQEVFAAIAERYAYLGLNAVGVCSQEVAGTHYIFFCTSGASSEETMVNVFCPVPGMGGPELVEVIR